MTMASNSSNGDKTHEEREALELVLEAARRANWDALHGPVYLRSGRYFVGGTPTVGDAAQHGVEPDGPAPSPSVGRHSAG